MEKLLRYFPLNKNITKKNTKNLLIIVGAYAAILVALLIVKKILIPVKVIGTFIYNVSSVYEVYAIVGVGLGLVTCFANIETAEVNYISFNDIKNLYKSDKKIVAWIATALVVVAAMIITPMGLKEERFKREVDKYIAEDHSDESSKKSSKKKDKKEEKEIVEDFKIELIQLGSKMANK